jgi:hypothetical protein
MKHQPHHHHLATLPPLLLYEVVHASSFPPTKE